MRMVCWLVLTPRRILAQKRRISWAAAINIIAELLLLWIHTTVDFDKLLD